jgi:hypothetical protein
LGRSWAERCEAGDQGGDLLESERHRIRRGVPRQPVTPVRTRNRLDRHSGLAQPSEISFHGAQTYPEMAGQGGAGHRLPDRSKKLDQPLLPFNPPKGEVAVT